MMKTVFWVLLLVGVSLGQESGSTPDGTTSRDQLAGVSTSANTHPLERVQTPTYEDLYCAGFITKQDVPHDTFVAGGLHSPHATKFVKNEVIFLSGSKFKEGDRVALIRELVDPNRYEMLPVWHRALDRCPSRMSALSSAALRLRTAPIKLAK